MRFYATHNGERVYVLDLPSDDQAAHIPDLAKLGITDFQAQFPGLCPCKDGIHFGFEFDDSDTPYAVLTLQP